MRKKIDLTKIPTEDLADELVRRHADVTADASVAARADAARHVALGAWLAAALAATRGDRAAAAAALGVRRATVVEALARYPDLLEQWPPEPGSYAKRKIVRRVLTIRTVSRTDMDTTPSDGARHE
jgi:hypothetical protein